MEEQSQGQSNPGPDKTVDLNLDLDPGIHPEIELLVAFHHRRLATAEAEQIVEHLSLCDHCADLLLDMAEFEGMAAPSESTDVESTGVRLARVADLGAERDWRDLAARIDGDRKERALPTTGRRGYALAAGFAAAAVGLGLWVLTLRTELTELGAPQVNVPIVNLRPAGSLRSGDEAVEAQSAGDRFVVILNPSSEPADVEHRVHLLRGDEEVWSGTGLRPSDAGNFFLVLPRKLLPPGDYRLIVAPAVDATAAETSEFNLKVAP